MVIVHFFFFFSSSWALRKSMAACLQIKNVFLANMLNCKFEMFFFSQNFKYKLTLPLFAPPLIGQWQSYAWRLLTTVLLPLHGFSNVAAHFVAEESYFVFWTLCFNKLRVTLPLLLLGNEPFSM